MLHARTCLAFAAVCLLSGTALANPEPAVLSDGRSVAMGGTGVATNDYATAPYHNPAGLSSVKTFSGTFTFTPFLGKVTAPFTDPVTGQTEEVESERSLAPLMTAAVGIRVHEKLALGAIAFLTAGSGAKYEGAIAGRDLDGRAFAGEAQIPVAFSVTKDFSIGAAYRITTARLEVDAPAPNPPPAPPGISDTSTTMSGTDFAGFSLGARYRVNDTLRLGATYRSKVVVDLEGETEIDPGAGAPKRTVDVEGEFPVPHTFKVGSEISLLDRDLVIAVDAAYWMYSDSHDENPEKMRAAAWDDAVSGIVGVEGAVAKDVRVRGGVNIGNSATSSEAAQPLGLPPGMMYTFTAGGGVTLAPIDLDFAVGYTLSAGKDVSTSENPTGPGKYSGNTIAGSVSVGVRL
jgi:long-subunit fatty acid transport protein